MPESFDIKKLLASPMTGLFWVKSAMFGLGIGMIIFTAYGLYKAYFKTPSPTTIQSAGNIENHYHQPKVTFGCASTRVYQKYPVNGVK